MRAVKANKEYTISAEQKEFYLNEGYDIIDDKGKIIEHSPKKTIPYSEYQKVKKELDEIKENSSNTELTKKVEELTKENSELTKANTELTKKVEELTKKNEKAN